MKNKGAFHGDPAIKQKYLERVKKHHELDEIVQGKYWENGKGCAVGCTMEINEGSIVHKAMKEKLGILETIAHVEERIFEGLSNGEAKEFPVKFLEAIPVGADLSLVLPKFMVWLLTDLKKYAEEDSDVLSALNTVIKLHLRIIKGKMVSDDEWLFALGVATTASRTVWGASRASIEAAAWSVGAFTWHSRFSTKSASWGASIAFAEAVTTASIAFAWVSEDTAAAYHKMSKKLLKLLSEAPITNSPDKEEA